MTAKETFEELGYKYHYKCGIEKNMISITGNNFAIMFSLEHKEYWHTPMSSITIEEHQAIHQQMKELGWIK